VRVHSSPDITELKQGNIADPRLDTLLYQQAVLPDTATIDSLPPLSALHSADRHGSAVVDNWKNGSLIFSQSGGTIEGNSLLLTAGTGARSWAVYELDAPALAFKLQQFKLDIGIASFGGTQPGYWVMLADFSKQRWVLQGNYSLLNCSLPLSGNANFVSPSQKLYAAVILPGNQSMTIARVGLNVEDSNWQVLELATGPASGITPAIDFTPGGNPAVVWAEGNGHVRFAVCERSAGFAKPASWIVSTAEDNPASASVLNTGDPESPNARAMWLDLLIDPDCSLPRISPLYTGLSGSNGNCRIGCTVLGDIPVSYTHLTLPTKA
jgi:hypothetical protein